MRSPVSVRNRGHVIRCYEEHNAAVRDGDWKLIEFFEDSSLELYNLRDDLSESNNLAQAKPELAKQLQQQLAAWRSEVGARMPTKNPKYDPKQADQWWSRGSNKPLDIEAMRKRYETKQASK